MKIDNTEISPFTGQKSVVIETENNIETRICMDTGFTTNTSYKIGSIDIQKFEETTSELIRSLRFEDTNLGQYWYPTTVMFSTGIIYPVGNTESWSWNYAPVVKLSEEEKLQYPIPGRKDEYYETRLATELAQVFAKDKFKDVCKMVGVAKEVSNA